MSKMSYALIFGSVMGLLFFVSSAEAGSCPRNCVSWYDGCNTCACQNGRTTSCTRRYCKRKTSSRCLKRYTKPIKNCRNVRCEKYRVCRMIGNRPVCLCRKMRIKCPRGFKLVYRWSRTSRSNCRIPYCRRTCRNVRCGKYKYCVMSRNRPVCVCRRTIIKCPRGYGVFYRKIRGCRVPYCNRTCRNVRCPKFQHCSMRNGRRRPVCVCNKIVYPRCPPGATRRYTILNGCRFFAGCFRNGRRVY